MNRKFLPALFMLTSAAVMSIITYVMEFSIIGKLLSLFGVIVVFGILGYVLRATLDFFEKQNQLKKMEEESAAAEEAEHSQENAEENGQDGQVSGRSAV